MIYETHLETNKKNLQFSLISSLFLSFPPCKHHNLNVSFGWQESSYVEMNGKTIATDSLVWLADYTLFSIIYSVDKPTYSGISI